MAHFHHGTKFSPIKYFFSSSRFPDVLKLNKAVVWLPCFFVFFSGYKVFSTGVKRLIPIWSLAKTTVWRKEKEKSKLTSALYKATESRRSTATLRNIWTKKRRGKERESMVLWEKNEPATVSIRFHTIHTVKTNLWKSQILVLYITILYSAWEICSEKGCWSGYLSGRSRAELPRFQEIWGALRNSCQSVSLSSSSRLTLANENVWRGEEEAGEERWKVCRLFIVCKLNGKCSLSLKKGGWLCLGLSHILCSVRIKSFVSYWSYGNISLGRFSPF